MAGGAPVDSLLDILELIARIERQTGGLTREEFLGNTDVQDATAYRILAIGEAAMGLDDAARARYPQVPWRQILGIGNILAHEYFVRESEIIWETDKTGLPVLAAACRAELARLGGP